jgi:hypothetical protein
MKKYLFVVGFCLMAALRASAQFEIIDEVIKAAIEAVDLGVQKVQNQTLIIQDAQKELENVMAQLHLQDITGWVKQQRDLYSGYYQELWQVKNAIGAYGQLKGIVEKQIRLVLDCRRAYLLAEADAHFSAVEVGEIKRVLDGLLTESGKNIALLEQVLKAFVLQMNDADRLGLLSEVSRRIDSSYGALRVFTQQNSVLSLHRSKSAADAEAVKGLYGIK